MISTIKKHSFSILPPETVPVHIILDSSGQGGLAGQAGPCRAGQASWARPASRDKLYNSNVEFKNKDMGLYRSHIYGADSTKLYMFQKKV